MCMNKKILTKHDVPACIPCRKGVGGCLLLSSLLTLLSFFSSCSNISEDERYIYVKPADVNRCVLVEDFTGQRCTNCPRAIDEIHRLQEQYGDDVVIAVGIHSGPLGFKTNQRFLGLKTDTGDEYYNYWNLEYQPVGMVNRTGAIDYTSWGGRIYEELQKTAPLSITLSTSVNVQDRQLDVETSLYGVNGNFTGKLQLWIVEDNITAFQMMPDGSRQEDYVHQHVFRAAVNGTWGEDIKVNEGQQVNFKCKGVPLSDDWNVDNLFIIAFVYDDNGVQQVTKLKLQ